MSEKHKMEMSDIFLLINLFISCDIMGIRSSVKSRAGITLGINRISVLLSNCFSVIFNQNYVSSVLLPPLLLHTAPNNVKHLSDYVYHSRECIFPLKKVNSHRSFGLIKKYTVNSKKDCYLVSCGNWKLCAKGLPYSRILFWRNSVSAMGFLCDIRQLM